MAFRVFRQLLLTFKGKIVNRQVGALPEPMLRDLVDQFLEVVKDYEQE